VGQCSPVDAVDVSGTTFKPLVGILGDVDGRIVPVQVEPLLGLARPVSESKRRSDSQAMVGTFGLLLGSDPEPLEDEDLGPGQ
jgi:hypothetical protein